MRGYRELADDLRQRIEEGEFQPGSTLPHIPVLMEEYGLARQTVRAALAELANQGFVVIRRKLGTLVRDRSSVHVPFSRYSNVLSPGGDRGPWESACAGQGLNGRMAVIEVRRIQASDELAEHLQVQPGSDLVYRRRHALIGDEIAQVQQAWYPADLAERAGIGGGRKVVGGVYGALTAAGLPPRQADERIKARMPTSDEAGQLQIGTGVPILTIERVTRTDRNRVVEVLRVVAPADRLELVYDGLPLREGGT